MRVVATVVSTAVPGRAIIDAGSKTFSSDLLGSGPKSGYGYVVEAPDAPIIKLNEEHGYLDITQSQHKFPRRRSCNGHPQSRLRHGEYARRES